LTLREKLEAAMIRIQVLSDLHIEFGELRVPDVDADVAVLAGDIHVGRQAAIWSGNVAEHLGIPIVQIAGNHEHYGTLGRPQQHFGRTLDELRAAAATGAGRVVFLERDTAIIAGVRFVGCTLWTDFELYGDPSEAMAHAEIGMTDFHTIAYRSGARFTANDARREFLRARRFLTSELAKPFVGPTVVVTHHLPSVRSVPQRFRADMLSAAFASHLDSLVEASGAELWIHGHTHDSCDYRIGKTRVLCNPRGYYDFALNARFDPGLVVEVGATDLKRR
jgi:predicted phosphodiesterase